MPNSQLSWFRPWQSAVRTRPRPDGPHCKLPERNPQGRRGGLAIPSTTIHLRVQGGLPGTTDQRPTKSWPLVSALATIFCGSTDVAERFSVDYDPALLRETGYSKTELDRMPFQPGKPKTGGRKPGQPNHTTQVVRDAVILAAQKAGGGDLVEYLKSRPSRTRLRS